MKRTVVIGAGRMGRRHIEVVRMLGLELVGVADANRETLEAAATEYGVPAGDLSVDALELLAERRPQVVVIATTAPTHAQLTLAATESGATHILCEKPMATSLAECDSMVAACRAAGASLAINHQMRFMEQYTAPKEILDSERLGGMKSVNVVAGNFGLAMNGTHYFEMFRFMSGEMPHTVSAWFSPEPVPNPRGAEFEDRAGTVRIETPRGTRFVMDCSADQGHGLVVVYAARFGHVVVDELAGWMRVTARAAEHRHLPSTRYGMPWEMESRDIAGASVLEPTRAVLQALLDGQNYPTGEEGRAAVATLVAAYVSNETGNAPVRVDDSALPLERRFPWA